MKRRDVIAGFLATPVAASGITRVKAASTPLARLPHDGVMLYKGVRVRQWDPEYFSKSIQSMNRKGGHG